MSATHTCLRPPAGPVYKTRSCRTSYPARTVLAALATLAISPLCSQPATPPNNTASSSGEVRDLFDKERDVLSRWTEVCRIISTEREEWQTSKEILTERVALLDRQIQDLEKQLAETDTDLEKVQKEITGLQDQKKQDEDASQSLRENVARFEDQVRTLYGRLPAPLQQKIAPLFQRMPTDPATTKISLAERFQNVIGILNEVTKLQSEVSIVNEVRKMDDGKEIEVRTIYLGLTHGYYMSATGEYAGHGHFTDAGWQWVSKPDLAFELREVQAILDNKAKPKFIALPAQIQ